MAKKQISPGKFKRVRDMPRVVKHMTFTMEDFSLRTILINNRHIYVSKVGIKKQEYYRLKVWEVL